MIGKSNKLFFKPHVSYRNSGMCSVPTANKLQKLKPTTSKRHDFFHLQRNNRCVPHNVVSSSSTRKRHTYLTKHSSSKTKKQHTFYVVKQI